MVWSCYQKRAMGVSSYPYQFLPSTSPDASEAESARMIDYLKEVWNGIPSIRMMHYQQQLAVLHGGSGHEVIWAPDAIQTLRPVAFHPVHMKQFRADRLGNLCLLTREQPVWGAYVATEPKMIGGSLGADKMYATPIFPGKFMYHTHIKMTAPFDRSQDAGYQYYGRGEAVCLYKIVKFSYYNIQMCMKYNEKHGMPQTIAYYPNQTVDQDQVNAVINSFRDEAIVSIPRRPGMPHDGLFKVEYLMPPKLTTDIFMNFEREWTNPQIERVLLLSIGTMQGGKIGSSLATMVEGSQMGTELAFEWDSENIADTISTQLIPYIIWNVPKWRKVPLAHMPRYSLSAQRSRTRLNELSVVERVNAHVPVSAYDYYNASGVQPPRGVEQDELDAPVMPFNQQQGVRLGGRPRTQENVRPERKHASEANDGRDDERWNMNGSGDGLNDRSKVTPHGFWTQNGLRRSVDDYMERKGHYPSRD